MLALASANASKKPGVSNITSAVILFAVYVLPDMPLTFNCTVNHLTQHVNTGIT